MTTMDNAERAERRARQRELADRLKASGALDGIFEQIDAGEVPLGGDEGLLKGMLKAALERGLEVELTDHVGYERGDPDASLFPNSRNGSTAKMVSSEIGDVELAVPRDRNGSFSPQLVPKGARRLHDVARHPASSGLQGTSSYGAGLTGYLRAQGPTHNSANPAGVVAHRRRGRHIQAKAAKGTGR
jgi:hypothetical protein